MKKLLKVLLVVAVCALVMAPFMVYASDVDSITSSMESATADPNTVTKVTSVGGSIYKTIQSVGIVVAVIVVVAFGIQWIVATPAKKAELKGKIWNIVIGLAILLAASTLVGQVGSLINANK